jgi:hypothetical protein
MIQSSQPNRTAQKRLSSENPTRERGKKKNMTDYGGCDDVCLFQCIILAHTQYIK